MSALRDQYPKREVRLPGEAAWKEAYVDLERPVAMAVERATEHARRLGLEADQVPIGRWYRAYVIGTQQGWTHVHHDSIRPAG